MKIVRSAATDVNGDSHGYQAIINNEGKEVYRQYDNSHQEWTIHDQLDLLKVGIDYMEEELELDWMKDQLQADQLAPCVFNDSFETEINVGPWPEVDSPEWEIGWAVEVFNRSKSGR